MTTAPRPKVILAVTLSETGGAQTYVAELTAALVDEYDVLVIASGDGPLRDAVRAVGARYHRLRWMGRAVSWRDGPALIELIRLLRRERPAVLHLNSSKMGLIGRVAGRLAGVRSRALTVHGWAFDAHQGTAAKVYRLAERLANRLTTVFVCPSRYHAELGAAVGACALDRVEVIPNAVDVSHAPTHTPTGAIPTIISVGRFQAPKDFVLLTEALGDLADREFRAVYLGDGPDRSAIEKAVVRAGLQDRVALPGTVSDVPQRLAAADVFVLSSRSECFPISILEAMAAGLPVISTAVGGVPEAVKDGVTGTLVSVGDREGLRNALTELVDDPQFRRRLGVAGRQRALDLFDRDRFAHAHRLLYARLLRSR